MVFRAKICLFASMRLIEQSIPGVYVIELTTFGDERGLFARTFCRKTFEDHDLDTDMVQTNMSLSREKGTLRGLHWQRGVDAEAKLVRCTSGSIFDVAVDIRPDSSTFLQWTGTTLSRENRHMLYVPRGFAHGFLTLEDHTEVSYQVSNYYNGAAEAGLRYDDPALGIEWPMEPTVLSEKDTEHKPCTGESDPRFL